MDSPNAKVPGFEDESLKHRDLVGKIFLLREQLDHAAILALDWAHWQALSLQSGNIKAPFFKNGLHAFWLT